MAERVKDLVCGMEFDKEAASGTFEYKGKTYYFCSLGCRDEFESDPEKYSAHEHDDGEHAESNGEHGANDHEAGRNAEEKEREMTRFGGQCLDSPGPRLFPLVS